MAPLNLSREVSVLALFEKSRHDFLSRRRKQLGVERQAEDVDQLRVVLQEQGDGQTCAVWQIEGPFLRESVVSIRCLSLGQNDLVKLGILRAVPGSGYIRRSTSFCDPARRSEQLSGDSSGPFPINNGSNVEVIVHENIRATEIQMGEHERTVLIAGVDEFRDFSLEMLKREDLELGGLERLLAHREPVSFGHDLELITDIVRRRGEGCRWADVDAVDLQFVNLYRRERANDRFGPAAWIGHQRSRRGEFEAAHLGEDIDELRIELLAPFLRCVGQKLRIK